MVRFTVVDAVGVFGVVLLMLLMMSLVLLLMLFLMLLPLMFVFIGDVVIDVDVAVVVSVNVDVVSLGVGGGIGRLRCWSCVKCVGLREAFGGHECMWVLVWSLVSMCGYVRVWLYILPL